MSNGLRVPKLPCVCHGLANGCRTSITIARHKLGMPQVNKSDAMSVQSGSLCERLGGSHFARNQGVIEIPTSLCKFALPVARIADQRVHQRRKLIIVHSLRQCEAGI